ncbi:MAG TPA: class I SAM-dependent methyltransferase [Flavobacteriales bacterium]|nr:class I SAM-dependent methyltransferase [Flavobacteriales bacterium]
MDPTRPAAGEAATFFDRISGTYREKYAQQSPFHRYYFNERLDKAIHGLDLQGKDVLDIGSGTGNLYDALIERFPTMRFHATDVSSGMLAQSRVPEEQRFWGHAYDHGFEVRAFDAIFMLGVTTYLDPAELERNLAFIARSLKPGGLAIITFTNKHGLDHWVRTVFRLPMRLFGSKDKVLSSGLRTRAYSIREVRRVLAPFLQIQQEEVHNHTVFPLNLLLPGPSLRIAGRFARVSGAPAWLRFLSSDLMVHAHKAPNATTPS